MTTVKISALYDTESGNVYVDISKIKEMLNIQTTNAVTIKTKTASANTQRGVAHNGRVCSQKDPETGKYLRRFKSIKEASRITGIPYDRIRASSRCKNRLAGGYNWEVQ